MMNAPGGNTGRGRGIFARGRGRGGLAPRAQAQPAPLAAQMRQVLRLEEPDEMAVLRRFKDLGASRVKSVYGQTGLLEREVFVPSEIAISAGYKDVSPAGEYISLLDAEEELAGLEARRQRERALARREVRLPEGRRRLSWGSLSPDERRILLLSQKEFNSFRASQSGGFVQTIGQNAETFRPGTSAAQAATPPPQAEEDDA